MNGFKEKIHTQGQADAEIADAWLVLQTLPGMTPERLQKLMDQYECPAEALSAPASDFARLAGRKASETLRRDAPGDMAQRLRRQAETSGAWVTTRQDNDFPRSLAEIYGPPGALFVKGTLFERDTMGVAIVGTRKPTRYGRRIARDLATGLAERGITVISGLAQGIDAEAHQGALEAGGRTVGILGCGLGVNYPAGHGELREQIASSGAVISEFPWEAPPRPENFPRRNRLISGLSLGTVVVEAALRSGALLTARLALEQGREVMAVPGPVDSSLSSGCHKILKDGAHLIETANDILEVLPGYLQGKLSDLISTSSDKNQPERNQRLSASLPPPSPSSLSQEEANVFDLLGKGPNTIEGLTREIHCPPEDISGILLRLELQGLVQQIEGGLYERT